MRAVKLRSRSRRRLPCSRNGVNEPSFAIEIPVEPHPESLRLKIRFKGPSSPQTVRTLLELLLSASGGTSAEAAQMRLDIDPVTFWRHVQTLKSAGLLLIGERRQQGMLKSYLIPTERGRLILSSLIRPASKVRDPLAEL